MSTRRASVSFARPRQPPPPPSSLPTTLEDEQEIGNEDFSKRTKNHIVKSNIANGITWLTKHMNGESVENVQELVVTNEDFKRNSRSITPKTPYRPQLVSEAQTVSASKSNESKEYHFVLANAAELVKQDIHFDKALRFKDHSLFSSSLPIHSTLQIQTLLYHHSYPKGEIPIADRDFYSRHHSKKLAPAPSSQSASPSTSVLDLNSQIEFKRMPATVKSHHKKETANLGHTLPVLPKLPIHLHSLNKSLIRNVIQSSTASYNNNHRSQKSFIKDPNPIHPQKDLLKIKSVLEEAQIPIWQPPKKPNTYGFSVQPLPKRPNSIRGFEYEKELIEIEKMSKQEMIRKETCELKSVLKTQSYGVSTPTTNLLS